MSKEKTRAKRQLKKDAHFYHRTMNMRKKMILLAIGNLNEESSTHGYSPKIGRRIKSLKKELKKYKNQVV